MVMVYFFIFSVVTLSHVLRWTSGIIYARVYNCERLIWQLWTSVLSTSEVNFIVGRLFNDCLIVCFSYLFYFIVHVWCHRKKKFMFAMSFADEFLVWISSVIYVRGLRCQIIQQLSCAELIMFCTLLRWRVLTINAYSSFVMCLWCYWLIPVHCDNNVCVLNNWWHCSRDTAGQERFRTITTAYYRGAMVRLLPLFWIALINTTEEHY